MEIKKNLREFTLIALGLLIVITPFLVLDIIFGWIEVILGTAVIVVAGWPLIFKKKTGKLT